TVIRRSKSVARNCWKGSAAVFDCLRRHEFSRFLIYSRCKLRRGCPEDATTVTARAHYSVGELELLNAIQLRLFRNAVRPSEARAASAAFRADLRDGVFAMLALPKDVYARARQLASKWSAKLGTRSLDILHVAAAIGLRAKVLHTFDAGQR